MKNLHARVGEAVKLFWDTRERQSKSQGSKSGQKDAGLRAAVTGGNATDLWAAYREGAFKTSGRPWLGYVFILEDCPKSQSGGKAVQEPHFPVFPEFRGASYARRYEIFLTKLLRERLYDGASLILTAKEAGSRGAFSSPSKELSVETFAAGLLARAIAHTKTQS